jgi:hypothetical protein
MRKMFLLFSLFLITGVFLQAQTVDVTFQVDMRIQALNGYFNPLTEVVTCPGAFNNWLNEPPANTEKVMADLDGDSIYTITIAMAPSTTYGYKFNIGLGWDGKDEKTGDRSVVVGTTNMTVDVSFFNEVGHYTGIPSTLTFKVDMRGPLMGTMELTDHVYLAGIFTNWAAGAIEMTGPDEDSVYTAIDVSFTSGDIAAYKFLWSTGAASSGVWESIEASDSDAVSNYPNPGDVNRGWGIHDGSNAISKLWQNDAVIVQTYADGAIFFEVDMSVATELGVFNYNLDSVQIRGAFNGWNGSDVEKSHMTQDAANPDHWTIEVPFVQEILNSNQLYKFFINDADSNYANGGWEVPIEHTNGNDRNRGVIFQGDPSQSVPYAWFENINTDWVIPAGTTVECTFMVDMTNAANPDSQTTPFVPGTDTVFWSPQQPLYFALNDLPWGVNPRVLALTNTSGMIYEGTLTIDGPAFNGFLYNYAYSTGTAGTLISESGAQGGARVRFIGQNGARAFVSPWDMPLDVWSNSEKPEEFQPAGWTSVNEVPGNPQTYSLEQNFPNPFNPSTIIRFSIPEQGLVTLKVFNLLGEEVATLINTEMTTGTYDVDFRATNVSSGIYFYTLTSGNFISMKKMIVLK